MGGGDLAQHVLASPLSLLRSPDDEIELAALSQLLLLHPHDQGTGGCWSSPVIVDGGTAAQGELEFVALRGAPLSPAIHNAPRGGRGQPVSPGMCQGAERAAALSGKDGGPLSLCAGNLLETETGKFFPLIRYRRPSTGVPFQTRSRVTMSDP